ncbi:MAG: DUF551 domain-containing protein [Flavobacteriales bacterium]
MSEWISIQDQLPEDGQRLLGYIPGNRVFLPGKSGEFEMREVVILKFLKDFYPTDSEKCAKHGPHFWQGEGNSNHFFKDVTHWMELPAGVANDE